MARNGRPCPRCGGYGWGQACAMSICKPVLAPPLTRDVSHLSAADCPGCGERMQCSLCGEYANSPTEAEKIAREALALLDEGAKPEREWLDRMHAVIERGRKAGF